MESKSIFRSKLFWINVLAAIVEIGQSLSGTNLVPSGHLLVGVNIANILLRRLTSDPVHVVTPRQEPPTP